MIAGVKCQVAFALARRTVTIRLDGDLIHAIADNALVGTWPGPITAERAARLPGARTTSTPLPPLPLPAGSVRVQRRVHASGRFMVNKQFIKIGIRHASKLVTVVIEDTHYRVLHGEEELAISPRRDTTPVTRLYVRGKGTQPG
ncbi:hypothetical protein BJF79_21680 [Actinomadura sp. CNU-125]|uniref:hypothetical protein n=1 Tax=Actinomadura sp. CNU-125 TaxID=1904961 RepID=UPI0009614EE8|nr:hypothetical protein [Actinomadura sp. CNU-125]OLT12712.1 hypothetical protein BJF79_21680 [Actinomadura sp. CNU-125]